MSSVQRILFLAFLLCLQIIFHGTYCHEFTLLYSWGTGVLFFFFVHFVYFVIFLYIKHFAVTMQDLMI